MAITSIVTTITTNVKPAIVAMLQPIKTKTVNRLEMVRYNGCCVLYRCL